MVTVPEPVAVGGTHVTTAVQSPELGRTLSISEGQFEKVGARALDRPLFDTAVIPRTGSREGTGSVGRLKLVEPAKNNRIDTLWDRFRIGRSKQGQRITAGTIWTGREVNLYCSGH